MYGSNHPERIKLNNKIKEWNSNRLDLFQISEPNEYLEFYGVMRFFYQGDDFKYQTKCLRVNSTATTIDVVKALVVKFHPDIKTLNNDKYVLYESHNLQDRRMKNNEHPLIVQLSWAFDDKDGKFILKNESRRRRSTDMTNHSILSNYGMSRSTTTLTNGYDSQTLRTQSSADYSSSSNFFSRRFSNSKKSKRKSKEALEDAEEAKRLAEELSGKPPESSFTRTISNPDDVMKRRRQKKLESRLEQFSGVKGDGETGGTLKIYGDSINPDIPYKTLLLSVNDTTDKILQETLDKYGIPPEEYQYYVLVQQNVPPREIRNRVNVEEIILHDQDCPLGILVHCPPKQGSAMFSVRRKQKSDRFPSTPRMPPFAFSKNVSTSDSDVRSETRNDPAQRLSSSSTIQDEYSETIVDYPRLRKLFLDADGSLYDDDNGLFSLSSLVNRQPKDALPTDGSRVIKIGSQSSTVGNYPNIWLPLDDYCDIRSVHCHISAKLDPQTNRMKFLLTPTLDSSSRTPRPCVIFINQQRIDSSTRICNDDIIQLGDSAMFKFEEFEEEEEEVTESINSRSVEEVDHETFENSPESINISHFTSDLPITIKYKYKRSLKLVEAIMKFSTEYADRGSKELYSSNSRCEENNLSDTFRLSPSYMLYLVMRAALGDERQIVQLIDLVADHIDKVIQEDRNNVEKEVFWLSNTSELLHLLQCDHNLRLYSATAQEVLASAIEHTFSIVQQQFSKDLMILLPALLSEDDLDIDDNTQEDNIPCLDRASILTEQGSIDYPIQHLLQTLSLAFTLFHNCQVNVALTVQMFSQLFHLLNTWLFNTVLEEPSSANGGNGYSVPVCQEWGNRLTRRLNRIRYWSEINGLEMAANCHLQKMYQVAELMKADKSDLAIFGEKCIEMMSLNGAQLQHLLINCQDYELPDPWIEVVVNTAIQVHDQDFNDSVDVSVSPQTKATMALYEDMELRLPLLLPADGYCCDRGIVSCPDDLQLMLNAVKDNLKYRLNPPTLNDVDIRWKSYLGTCQNTPTVSRSNTIDQSPLTSPKKSDQPYLPRNWVPSDEISITSETLSSQSKEHYQKRTNVPTSQIRVPGRPVNGSEASQSHSILKNGSTNRIELKLRKIDNSLGLSIIAAKATSKDMFRIYVKDVIVGGAGSKCGQISPGDQLVSIDGNLLDDMSQDEAVAFMKKTKSELTLLIDKGAAHRHGLMEAIMQARSNKNNTSIMKSNQKSSNVQAPVIKKPLSVLNTPPKLHQQKEEPIRLSLPPPPTSKAPPRPQPQAIMNNAKMTSRKVTEPDYSSLPVRKHQSSQLANIETPVYSTVRKGQHHKVKFETNLQSKSPMSNSQPNLSNVASTPRRPRAPSSSSESSSSGSMSTTDDDNDDEDSITSVPKPTTNNNEKRNSSSVYEKLPPPVKSISDSNIGSNKLGPLIPGVASSDSELKSEVRKRQFLPRPAVVQNIDPVISIISQDDTEPISLNKPVSRDKSSSVSSSSSSQSESETLSSASKSSSASASDSSPKPHRKEISEPIPAQVDNGNTIPQPTTVRPATANQSLSDRRPLLSSVPNLGGFQKPIRLTNTGSDDQMASLPRVQAPQIPDTKVTESLISKPELPKGPSEEEIKLRRKAIADSIRQQTEEKERRCRAVEATQPAPTAVNNMENNVNKRHSTKYGRPEFNANNPSPRPVSLLKPDQQTNDHLSHETDFKLPSPPSSISQPGIIVMSSKLYGAPVENNNNNNNNNQDGVEGLSFRDKMKLFAAKIGDDTVIERQKCSSKQQKINSGDYS